MEGTCAKTVVGFKRDCQVKKVDGGGQVFGFPAEKTKRKVGLKFCPDLVRGFLGWNPDSKYVVDEAAVIASGGLISWYEGGFIMVRVVDR